MSRLYDTVEPSVIDDSMLKAAIEEQGPQEEAGNIARKDGMPYEEVERLRLDFKNILRIENLWQFHSLVKLQLDNNIIEKIEGLDTLKNLVWLDLSFNNIEKIEGLESLPKLTDLSLYNNRISKLENMDVLEHLEVFSIGNNVLDDFDDLLYLRNFKSLKTLCLRGNPFCEKEDYLPYALSHLPQIIYLDYRLVDEKARAEGMQKFDTDLQQLASNEEVVEKNKLDEKTKDVERELNKEAYVEGLNGDYLFESLFAEDPEGKKLKDIPGGIDLHQDFSQKFTNICLEMYAFGIKEKKVRDDEVKEFWKCINEVKHLNTVEATRLINEFMEAKKRITDELASTTDSGVQEAKFSEYTEEVNKLWEQLMANEVQIVDQLEETIKDFERNMSELVNNFVEQMQGLFSQQRELENIQFEKLNELCIITLEKVIKNEIGDDFPDDLRDLFIDKDTVVNAVQTSHDAHLLRIDNREDDMISKIKNWQSNMLDQIHEEEEYKRNRKRVMEINRLIDYLREELYEPADMQEQN